MKDEQRREYFSQSLITFAAGMILATTIIQGFDAFTPVSRVLVVVSSLLILLGTIIGSRWFGKRLK